MPTAYNRGIAVSSLRTMMAACKSLVALAAIVDLMGAKASSNSPSTPTPLFADKTKSCRRIDEGVKSFRVNYASDIALKMRGGDGIWGKSEGPSEGGQRPSDLEQPDSADAAITSTEPEDDEYEYEYEYEYYEIEDDANEGGVFVEYEDEDGFEYEYYEEGDEENPVKNYGRVQDINGEFMDSDEDSDFTSEATPKTVEDGDGDDADAIIELKEEISQEGKGRSFWGQSNKKVLGKEAEADYVTESNAKSGNDRISEEKEEEEYEDDEDYLLSTPIPAAKERNVEAPSKVQLANRTIPKTDIADEEYEEYEENENSGEKPENYDENAEDYLLETPISKAVNGKSVTRRAREASNTNHSRWWQYRPNIASDGDHRRRQQWRPSSSTKASFISPLFYSGAPRSFSMRSSSGRPVYSEWVSSISAAVAAVIQPIGNVIQRLTFSVASTMSSLISMSWAFVRNSFDFLWYGPVDGVTITGIASREGGLSALLMSPPVVIAVSSIVMLSLMRVLVIKVWRERAFDIGRSETVSRDNEGRRFLDGYSEDDDYEEVDDNPPSIEEELRFLNRDFDAANPSSKELVTKAITEQKRFSWPSWRRDKDKSRRGQRQFTIKSIQTWWKERPSQQSIAIIEPQHLRNQQQPLNHEIKHLQKQLAVSEQERAILQNDVQRLQHKLQKTQHDARSIVSQNKWLEKQTSKADRILARAVEVERRKANEEMGRVRESMMGVLEQERMLMRQGRQTGSNERRENVGVGGGQNDVDLVKGPSVRVMDGVKIVRDVDGEEYEEISGDNDREWTAM